MRDVDDALIELLRCPITGARLRREGDALVTVDTEPPRRYRIVDGIPVLLPESPTQSEEAHG